jgi:hypothetical protein
VDQERLLKEVFERRKHYIASVCLDVPHEFEKRPVMLHVPEKVRQEN